MEVRAARDEAELRAALRLRHAVFVDEQGVDPAQEWDGRDGEATHLVAIDAAGTVVGTCRLLARGTVAKLGRLAVTVSARRQGLGTALLRAGEVWAREVGCTRIVLHAQTYARALYAAAGYEAVGETFMEAEIEHVRMERDLA
ncbi:MAG TPA: GNAT family N-acetyltransferase [Solirubrobacteraceae bacterium]|nr:GNAT family N-acetyltransferase [Solirubrobacteraceae bacterium]